MKIRKGTTGDIDEVACLYDAITDYLEQHMNYPGWRKGIYPTREDAERGIGEGTLFVAEVEGKIAGTMILRHEPESGYALADWKTNLEYDEIFVLYTLAVHPTYLKMGIGRKIMEFVLDYAAECKMKAVRLDVYEKNTPAIHLYESLGFRYIDTLDLGYSQFGLDKFRLYQKLL